MTEAVSFQFVVDMPGCDDQFLKSYDVDPIKKAYADTLELPVEQVRGTLTCGSAVFDLYAIPLNPADTQSLVQKANDALDTTAKAQAIFGSALPGDVSVVRVNDAAVVTVKGYAPPPPPPSPPPPRMCATVCTRFHDGASIHTTEFQFLCAKWDGNCRPMYGNRCPSDMPPCHMAHSMATSIHCMDQQGRWASRKCPRKVAKNKCHKRRVRRYCPASCRIC